MLMERPSGLPCVPPADKYRTVLRGMELSHALTAKQRQMLMKHYRSPGRVITATELARLVDYPDWNTVNLQYGLLGQSLADRMNWVLPPESQSAYSIAWFEKPEGTEEHWRWHMHPELATALEGLGWVKPPLE
jgi:hypothetical protein